VSERARPQPSRQARTKETTTLVPTLAIASPEQSHLLRLTGPVSNQPIVIDLYAPLFLDRLLEVGIRARQRYNVPAETFPLKRPSYKRENTFEDPTPAGTER
jgi:hypothetical protein